MNYSETVAYLYNSAPLFQQKGAGAYKPGLQTTHSLDAYLGHPHRHFPAIHVGGTNGKGSTCHTLAAILQAAGLRVGLFTSPHLVDFRERIRINGQKMPEAYVVDFVERHRAFFEPLHPSFFELTTAMAFRYFADENVDIAVIEVGLGGRLDCTNIITPLLSVVTNISLDHTALLGDTPEAIAREKAGIFKAGIPALVGETTPATRRVFAETAQAVGAPVAFAEDEREILAAHPGDDGLMHYETRSFGPIESQLTGLCQPLNANTVLCAVRLLRETPLSPALTDENVRRGFRTVCDATGLLGRWQTLQQQPLVIADTGHNAGGWDYLSRQLSGLASRPEGRLFCLLGFAADKDVNAILPLLPPSATYLWTQASVDRAMKADVLAAKAQEAGLPGRSFRSVKHALATALREAAPQDAIFVGGSTFVVADALQETEG
ncbi:MAG: bifunctional folylpolyglutamate synthase/dihydrofolate synthase [Alloprevotella sp.]|nr:bifunctional folylpolyglutamate synthase/dihydrofolate synthase [Alloprevotella sp.]